MNSYVRSMLRGWWVGVLALGVTLTLAHVLTQRQTPVYRATSTLVVAPDPAISEVAEVLRTVDALERRSVLATFAELVRSPRVKQAAAQELEWDPARASAYRISASVLPHANVLRVSVEGPDADGVAALSRAAASMAAAEGRRLYSPFAAELLAEASAPMRPTLPDPRRNLLVAGTLGLFLGLGLALAYGHVAPLVVRMIWPQPVQVHAAD